MELQELRNEINRIDGEMLALLEQRLAVCRAIAEYKRQNGLPVRDPARETEKLHEAMEQGGAAGQRLALGAGGQRGGGRDCAVSADAAEPERSEPAGADGPGLRSAQRAAPGRGGVPLAAAGSLRRGCGEPDRV